jgi:hypothetical protein
MITLCEMFMAVPRRNDGMVCPEKAICMEWSEHIVSKVAREYEEMGFGKCDVHKIIVMTEDLFHELCPDWKKIHG